MRRTKIVCTLGPSSETPELVRRIAEAGMDVARLNFSHGSHADHRRVYDIVRDTAAKTGRNIAILADLQGPKIRTGTLQNGTPILLEDGGRFVLTTESIVGAEGRVSTTYAGLTSDVRAGDRILVADGALELQVEEVAAADVVCQVIHGGKLGEHKGINLPGTPVSAPSLTEKDLEDLAFALELGVDYVALSFVRHADEIRDLKKRIEDAGKEARVVAKIERPEALEHFDEILALTDVIMVARGDLGVEMPLDRVPQIQKDLIRRCNRHGVPVITATQMLESMMHSARPTRAEVNDVANAIYDGTDAVMLSGETAAGAFPVESVRIMAQVAKQADDAIAHRTNEPDQVPQWMPTKGTAFGNAIGEAVYHISERIDVERIVCFTSSGFTAATISRFRPHVPITAFTRTEMARRWCAMFWGVEAIQAMEADSIDEMVRRIDRNLTASGLVNDGDVVILVAGTPLALAGRTNLLKLHTVGDKE